MLVVQENSGYFKDKNVWKVPTGTIKEVSLLDLGTFVLCVCVILSIRSLLW